MHAVSQRVETGSAMEQMTPAGSTDRPADHATEHVLGPADAEITLIEYGSYACPQCRGANERIARQAFPGATDFSAAKMPCSLHRFFRPPSGLLCSGELRTRRFSKRHRRASARKYQSPPASRRTVNRRLFDDSTYRCDSSRH